MSPKIILYPPGNVTQKNFINLIVNQEVVFMILDDSITIFKIITSLDRTRPTIRIVDVKNISIKNIQLAKKNGNNLMIL